MRPVLEAADRRLEPLDLLLLGDELLLLALQLQLAGERVGGVVPGPHADPAAVQLRDLADRLVEQVAVVRHGHGGAVEGGEQALEQRAADGVEVRLRLVEQQHVRILREARCQRDQLALAARERTRRQRQVGFLDPEVEQHRARPAVDARPAGRFPALDQLLLAAKHARHPVEVGRELGRGQLLGHAMQVAVELVEIGTGRADGLERVSLVAERMLGEEGDDDAAPPHRRAGVGLLEPGDQPQHRRLARAVRADDAHAGARLDREVEAVEHGSAPERLAHGVQRDEGHLATPGRLRLAAGGAGLRRSLASLAALRPAARTFVLFHRATHRERRARSR